MIHTESDWGLSSVLSRSPRLISIPCPLKSSWVFFPSSKYSSDRSADLLREPGGGGGGWGKPAPFSTATREAGPEAGPSGSSCHSVW